MIQGVYCHETGCPNTGKVKRDNEWIMPEEDSEERHSDDKILGEREHRRVEAFHCVAVQEDGEP